MNVLFRLRNSTVSDKIAYVYCRITIDKKRCSDFSLGLEVNPKRVSRKPFFVHNNATANRFLEQVKQDLESIYLNMLAHGTTPTANSVRDAYVKEEVSSLLLVDVLYQFVYKYKKKEIGIKIKQSTWNSYEDKYNTFVEYLSDTHTKNIEADNLKVSILEKFADWATIEKQYCTGFINKVINLVKAALKFALREELINTYRLESFTNKKEHPKEIFSLSMAQFVLPSFLCNQIQSRVYVFLKACRALILYTAVWS